MPDERRYYVHSDDNCRFESMTKEQILAAITQAVEGHSISDVDTGFVQVLKEQNHGTGLKFWVGSSAEYNALQTIEQDVFYILTDDTELDDMEADIQSFRESLNAMSEIVSGLSDAVASQSDTIQDLSVTTGNHDDVLWEIDARKSVVFLDQTVAYSDELSIYLDGIHEIRHGELVNITIDQFSIVRVYAQGVGWVTCNVSTDNTYAYICGTSVWNSTRQAGANIVLINLRCVKGGGVPYLDKNNSITIVWEANTNPMFITQGITKIVGVM